MAIPFVQSITMNDFQILNFVIHSSGTAPTNASGAGGMMWWDSTNFSLKVYNDNDTAWNSLVQGPASSTNTYIPQWSGTGGNKLSTGLQLKTTVGATGDDSSLVTEQGIREAIAAAVASGVTYQGGYNAATNTPDLDTAPSGVSAGDMYTVTAAGDFFTDTVAIGDVLIAEIDNASTLADWTVVAREWDETFLELGDTPASFSSAGNDFLRVNAGATAVEFVDATAINLSSFNNDLASLSTGTEPGIDMTSYNGSTARTIRLNLSSLGTDSIATGDFVAFYDVTAGDTHKLTIDSLITYLEGQITTIATQTTNAVVSSPGAGQDGYAIVWDDTAGEYTLDTFASGATSFLGLTDTPSSYSGTGNYIVKVNAGATALEFSALDISLDTSPVLGGTLAANGNEITGWSALTAEDGGTPSIRTNNVLGNTLVFQAYDTDLPGYVTFATLTAGTVPTFNLSTSVTVGGNTIATVGGAFHDGFSDFVANEHINHTSVSITAGIGLSGGGTIAASRTINIDFSSQSPIDALASVDQFLVLDNSGADYNTVSGTQLMTFVESSLDTDGYARQITGDIASGASPVITHSLGLTEPTDISVEIWRQSDNKKVGVEVTATNGNSVTVNFGSAAINPLLGTFRYVITYNTNA